MDFTPIDLFIILETCILIGSASILLYKAKKNDGKIDADELLEIMTKLRTTSVKTINEIMEAKVANETEQKEIINKKLLELINSDNSNLLECEKELLSKNMDSIIEYILNKKKDEEKINKIPKE